MRTPKELSELLALLTAAREDYRSMATGHAGLSGFCISMGERHARHIDAIFAPPKVECKLATDEKTETTCQ